MTLSRTATLQTERARITSTRWHETTRPALAPGQVRLEVEHVGFSANNVTYATMGEALHYWEFFPQEDPAWGCVPVWGYAAVRESRCPEVPEGRRFFGFLPFATDVVATPQRVRPTGFVDASAHRAHLPAAYNSYTDVTDEAPGRRREAYDALLRPLFTTSLLIADWLRHEDHLGAETVLVSSASSKTAYGTAYALTHLASGPRPEVVGLTSSAHLEATRRLGFYDRVLGYDEVDDLDAERPSVYVDLSGSAAVRAAVHSRCAGLRHDCAVGLTHWDATAAPGSSGALPGPEPQLFFAPAELERQAARVGGHALLTRVGDALDGFVARVSDPSDPLMTITWHEGRDAARAVHLEAVAGRSDPSQGAMVVL